MRNWTIAISLVLVVILAVLISFMSLHTDSETITNMFKTPIKDITVAHFIILAIFVYALFTGGKK
jgi:fumarate reductase subunit D